MNRTRRFIPILIIAMVVVLAACSNKTNTARSRFWQAFTTKYNVYYNGKTNYDEQMQAMMSAYEDDYSQHLFMHPAEARANPKAPQPGGSFERTIEKMEKSIALHSIKKKPKRKSGKGRDPKYQEWLARDEYNPFMHNAWYLLAKAQYMKGDFLDAAATFRYIARHFTWKKDLVQECQVREALCYCAMGWPTEADNVLTHVHLEEITNKRVRALANAAFADYHIKAQEPEQAIPYLAKAVKGFKGNQKVRMNFLLGQLYEDVGDKHNAYLAYKQAGSSSGSTYRTKFNARIKQSAVYEGTNIASEVKALKRMTRYDRNKDYLDQIYYAIGNLYLSHADTLNAIENYKLAAEKSTRNGVDKAISQLTLGGIYFARRQYDDAQPCYAEAIPQVNEDYPNYKLLKKRSDVLDELAVYSQNVTLQDSLLMLAAMTPAEQKAVIAKIIEELKKKEKEEAENAAREEYLEQQKAAGSQIPGSDAPTSFINNDDSWYFYNTVLKNNGKTQFQKLWGNRKLEDNWRRRNKTTFSFADEEESDSALLALADSMAMGDSIDAKVDLEALKRAEDPHYEEYYLKQIPKTEEEIQSSHEIIQEGLYNMGIILKDKMEDYGAAAYEFNELLRRYPDNTYRLDVFYNMYMMFMRNGQEEDAQPYRDSILVNFPESKYGMAMQDPNYLENLKNMGQDQERMYEEAYANYLGNNHQAVHDAYTEMMRKYPLSKIMPKFMFIDALSYLTEKNHDKFKETIKDMLQRYPQTDITPVASEIVKQLNQGRRLEGGGSNVRGMLWTTRLSNDTTTETLERTFTPFAEDNDKPQVFILLYPMDSVNDNLLLYEVARHNFNAFKVKDYDIEQMNFGELGLLVVKGMENFKEATHYRTLFEQDQTINVPRQVHYVIISVDNFNLLLNEGRTFEDYFNYLEEKNDKEHSDLEKKELDEAEKKAMEEAEAQAAAKREKERLEAEQMEREAAELAKRDAEEKAKEEAEEKARLEAEAAEKARLEAEEKARQEAERKKIEASDYRSRANSDDNNNTQQTLTDKERKAQERAEEEHLKQLEREAKAREKEERKRQKEIEDSIKKEQKHQRKLARLEELAEQDSIEQAEREKEKERDFRYKWREDSAKAAYKAAEQAKKDAKKEKERARKEKQKERKQLAKQREKERKEKAKERERERKAKQKERKQQAKAREQERKQRQKEREQERKEKAEQRKQQARDRQQAQQENARQGKQKGKEADNDKGTDGGGKEAGSKPSVSRTTGQSTNQPAKPANSTQGQSSATGDNGGDQTKPADQPTKQPDKKND